MFDLPITPGSNQPEPLDLLAGIRGLSTFARMIRSLERDEIEIAIEALIDHLDTRDGDPDLEPEEDAEHDGREPELWRERGRDAPLPEYGTNQSTPINGRAVEEWYLHTMESTH
jgi:hypothetical protein